MALIYVVEDDKSIQEIEVFALSGAGFTVKGFDNAKTFIAALEEKLPDIILLDIVYPQISLCEVSPHAAPLCGREDMPPARIRALPQHLASRE